MSGNIVKLDLHLVGVEELKENLRLLPARLQKPAIQRAMKELANPMVRAAQAGVLTLTGKTEKKILVSASLSRRQRKGAEKKDKETITVYVGVGPSRKAHLIEFGTAPRYTKTGHFTGSMPAHPFMTTAFKTNASAYLNNLGPVLGKEIEKTAARYNKKLSGYRSKKG